jgi:alkylation response protein AidB-like acyl-CoA dehydrogenase
MAGGARRCLDLSTEWATLREQFGRPIGSFQAVKHRCVAMLVDVEGATAAVRRAARLGDAGSADQAAAAWVALATALQAYRDTAAAAIQVHGGMGYVWEHEAHFHLKRAKGNARLFGGVAAARDRLAAELGL